MEQQKTIIEKNLKEVLNSESYLIESKRQKLKPLLLDYMAQNNNELSLKLLLDWDLKPYKTTDIKRHIYKRALKIMGFKIEKRQHQYRYKRFLNRYALYNLPDYRFKTFWFIVVNNQNKNDN